MKRTWQWKNWPRASGPDLWVCATKWSPPEKGMSHNQSPVSKWSTQDHAKNYKRGLISEAIYDWDSPLTFTYPSFEQVTHVMTRWSPGFLDRPFSDITRGRWKLRLGTAPHFKVSFPIIGFGSQTSTRERVLGSFPLRCLRITLALGDLEPTGFGGNPGYPNHQAEPDWSIDLLGHQ